MDGEQIKDLYRRYWAYMIAKDAAGLRQMMAEGYSLVHVTGRRQSAEAFLQGLINGTFNYYAAEHESIEVRAAGSRAALTAKSRVLASVYGGEKRLWRLRGDFTLIKENGRWLLADSKASLY